MAEFYKGLNVLGKGGKQFEFWWVKSRRKQTEASRVTPAPRSEWRGLGRRGCQKVTRPRGDWRKKLVVDLL